MSQTLKEIYCPRNGAVIQILYTNVRADPNDDAYIARQLRRAERSVSQFVSSERVRIAGLLWANFTREDWWCTFTFREDKLPPDRRKARARWNYFLRKLRAQGYETIRYLRVIEHRHGLGRYHYHAVMSGVPRKALVSTWRGLYGQEVYVKHFDPSMVWSNWKDERKPGLARYLAKESYIRETTSDTIGRHCYSRSRGASALREPEMVPPRAVPEAFCLQAPPGIKEDGKETLFRLPLCESSYLVYRAPMTAAHGESEKG